MFDIHVLRPLITRQVVGKVTRNGRYVKQHSYTFMTFCFGAFGQETIFGDRLIYSLIGFYKNKALV